MVPFGQGVRVCRSKNSGRVFDRRSVKGANVKNLSHRAEGGGCLCVRTVELRVRYARNDAADSRFHDSSIRRELHGFQRPRPMDRRYTWSRERPAKPVGSEGAMLKRRMAGRHRIPLVKDARAGAGWNDGALCRPAFGGR